MTIRLFHVTNHHIRVSLNRAPNSVSDEQDKADDDYKNERRIRRFDFR